LKSKFLALFSWTFLVLFSLITEPLFAEEPLPEIEEQISTQTSSLQEVRKGIKRKKEILDSFEKKEKGILAQLEAVDRKLTLKEEQLESYDLTLKKVLTRKEQLESEIGDLKAELARFQEYLAYKVIQLHKYGGYSYVKALFSADNYPDLLKRYRYLQIMAQRDRESIESYEEVYNDLNSKRQDLDEREKKVASLQDAFKEKNREILAKREERTRFLKRIRKEKAFQQELLEELEGSALLLQEAVETLIQKKETLFGNFENFKGELLWPVNGEVVTRFGKHKHAKFNTYIFSKGIDIEAEQGADVKAVYGGTVLFADWFKGYGQMVILDHGKGFYSLYAHLSKTLVPIKGVVEKGRAVGKVGETGSLKGPILYFEVRYHGEPQDPLTWLARR
jgi:septal ring factor EnvC (AmiA/AmiB activator)